MLREAHSPRGRRAEVSLGIRSITLQSTIVMPSSRTQLLGACSMLCAVVLQSCRRNFVITTSHRNPAHSCWKVHPTGSTTRSAASSEWDSRNPGPRLSDTVLTGNRYEIILIHSRIFPIHCESPAQPSVPPDATASAALPLRQRRG